MSIKIESTEVIVKKHTIETNEFVLNLHTIDGAVEEIETFFNKFTITSASRKGKGIMKEAIKKMPLKPPTEIEGILPENLTYLQKWVAVCDLLPSRFSANELTDQIFETCGFRYKGTRIYYDLNKLIQSDKVRKINGTYNYERVPREEDDTVLQNLKSDRKSYQAT